MKKKKSIILIVVLMLMLSGGIYARFIYENEMRNINIVFRHSSSGMVSSSYYLSERLLIILPEIDFHGDVTLNALKWYLWVSNKRIPDKLVFIFYEDQTDFETYDSYYSYQLIR